MDITIHKHTYRLPKLAQYEGIEYSGELCCPECYGKREYSWLSEMDTDEVVGYVEVNGELQIVKRCKYCGTLYRFHMYKKYNDDSSFDADAWKYIVGTHLAEYNHDYLEVKE